MKFCEVYLMKKISSGELYNQTTMKRWLATLLCILTTTPLLTSASGIPAGFAPSSIFASKTNITAGEGVVLFTVLYNSSEDELTADVIFTIDGAAVGTKHVSLASGETQTPSVSWTAASGSHSASAHLENIVSSSGEGASLSYDKADTITLTVAAPPPPPATTQALSTITSVIASSTPAVTNVAKTAYNSLEYLRQNAVSALQSQLGVSPSNPSPKGEVLGVQTYNPSAETAAAAGSSSIFQSLWHGVLSGLLFVCNIQILFYGLLLIVIFILYRLLRTWMQER